MPHVIVKLYSGRSEETNSRLAEAITKLVTEVLGSQEKSVSVGIEDIDPAAWAEQVFRPDIVEKSETLYKKPGYNPFA